MLELYYDILLARVDNMEDNIPPCKPTSYQTTIPEEELTKVNYDKSAKRKRQDHSDISDTDSVVDESIAKKVRIPPIVISQSITNISDFTDRMKSICSNIVTFKYNKTMSVYTTTIVDYKKVLKKLKELNVAHHTYTLQEDKPKYLVLRGLPSINIMKLDEELKNHCITPKRIVQMKKKIT
ncbi:hypothetical protein KQX54_013684 [Cotesia glomerata]|uniref:Uncharacterized protein n=1 Tax=Cotesia glomerata TaxID=32391 RepID=A0AAV7HWH7_COTGL|nr:hypothetical protein KQX54_013684 [Cotesia glomerata]